MPSFTKPPAAQKSPQKAPDIQDQCPPWAHQTILKILELEIQLGNILPPHEDWHQKDLESLTKRLYDTNFAAVSEDYESMVESYFRKIVRDLSHGGFSPAQIAGFINARLTGNSRMAYCSPEEVQEALSH